MKIAKINTHGMRNAEFTQFHAEVIEGAADYEDFIKTLNAIIAKYTAIIHARQGKKHSHKPEAGESEQESEAGTP